MTHPATPAPMHPLRRALTLWGAVIALMWLLLITDWILPARLTAYGITPRNLEGLTGIAAAPFLHSGAAHLAANTVPLIVMGVVAALRDWRGMWTALAVSLLTSGLGVWLFSPAYSVTVGASGVVFGLLGYLLARGFVMRRIGDFLIALAVMAVYGTTVWGIFPSLPHISWQGHLFGFLGGIAAAFMVRSAAKVDAPA
ncbi:rhomboid family intramembrane serine protease [Glycomyces tritici]|uniref:Rhomboid family intramembrane serine protease n=1 Tax=Glycomyces tritici TaxID=2665176 RepID=A0ABT7YVZ0_9ACTN|nr:rhomboid family intramembrane serine protease [Glycomyces tritici]MDN3242802.1 rhomboid family intramembrane serine protease [Glycomyces tritici]